MSLRDTLIKQSAEATDLPEDTVFKIITFQGEDALKAVKVVHELEFSGFGKFLLSQTKLKRKLKVLELTIEKHKGTEKEGSLQEVLEGYKKKLL